MTKLKAINQEMDQMDQYVPAVVTIRGKFNIGVDIRRRLELVDARLRLFRSTCFGCWLDFVDRNKDPLLVHLFLQTLDTSEVPSDEELVFSVGGVHVVRFTREDFCIITGMRFGLRTFPSTGDIPFQRRVFPSIDTRTSHVRGAHIRELFGDEARFARLSDADAVRVCLLLLVHHGFMGVQDDIAIPEGMLRLVEDFESWNSFPWGSFLWAQAHRCLSWALVKRKGILEKRKGMLALTHGHKKGQKEDDWKYNLGGFIYAFRIWIFETFPRAIGFASYVETIPRALGWRKHTNFLWESCLRFLDFEDEVYYPLEIKPTEREAATDWYQASRRFFDGVEEVVVEHVVDDAATTSSPRRGVHPRSGPDDDIVEFSSKKARGPETADETGPPDVDRWTLLERRMTTREARTADLERRMTSSEGRLHVVELILGIVSPQVDPSTPGFDRMEDMEDRISVVLEDLAGLFVYRDDAIEQPDEHVDPSETMCIQTVHNDIMANKMAKLDVPSAKLHSTSRPSSSDVSKWELLIDVASKKAANVKVVEKQPETIPEGKRMLEAKIKMQDEAIAKQKAMFEEKIQMQDEIIANQKAKIQMQDEVIAEQKAKVQIQDENIAKQKTVLEANTQMVEAAKLQHEKLMSLVIKSKIAELKVKIKSENPDHEVIRSTGIDMKSLMDLIPESLGVKLEARFSSMYEGFKSLLLTHIDDNQWEKIESQLEKYYKGFLE